MTAIIEETIMSCSKVSSTLVSFSNVSVHHYSTPRWLGGKPFKALSNVSLQIENQNIAIVGPSGAGKSTLIELLFGLRTPSLGNVQIAGRTLPLHNASERLRVCSEVQMVPQEPHTSLNPYYTVEQILIEPLENLKIGGNHPQLAQIALNEVGLTADLLPLYPQQLSTGQAQRIAIARALIVKPKLLVADEPTSSLDPVNRQRIIELLNSLKQKYDLQLLLVSHDLKAAIALCEEIVVLDQGEIVEYGFVKQIMEQPVHPTTQALIRAQIHSKTNT